MVLERTRARLRDLKVERGVAGREEASLRERLQEASAAASRLGALETEKATIADQLLDAHRELELERAHRAELESQRAAGSEQASELERRLEERAVALEAAAGETGGSRESGRLPPNGPGSARMAALMAERDEMQEAASSARRKANDLEASLAQLGEQATGDARSAAARTVELEAEIERMRMTVGALTSEGTVLRRSLTGAEWRTGA